MIFTVGYRLNMKNITIRLQFFWMAVISLFILEMWGYIAMRSHDLYEGTRVQVMVEPCGQKIKVFAGLTPSRVLLRMRGKIQPKVDIIEIVFCVMLDYTNYRVNRGF